MVLTQEGEASEHSDIDILLEMDPKIDPLRTGGAKLNMYDDLPIILGVKVDIVDRKYLKNRYLIATIEKEKKLFYEK